MTTTAAHRPRAVSLVVAVVVALGACSDAGGPPTAASDGSAEQASTARSSASPAAQDPPAASAEPPTASSSPEPAPTPLVEGWPTVELTTPTSGGGSRPELVWRAVPDAAHYSVVVLDPSGQPYWSTVVADTSVHVGGGDEALPDDRPGPRVADGSTWSVVALDAAGRPLAASERRPVSP